MYYNDVEVDNNCNRKAMGFETLVISDGNQSTTPGTFGVVFL